MAHTNSTTHYALPQFLTTDKPAWLTDINGAFSSIDTGIYNAKSAADSAQSDASDALTAASTASGAASAADTKAGGAVASISETFEATSTYDLGDLVMYNNLLYVCTTPVTTPGAWTGSTNWDRTSCDQLFSIQDAKIDNLDGTDIITNPGVDPSETIADTISDIKSDVSTLNTRTANISNVRSIVRTATTDPNGIITSSALGTNLDYDHHIILSAETHHNGTCINVGQYNKNFYFVATSAYGLATPIANTSITLRIVYMDAF